MNNIEDTEDYFAVEEWIEADNLDIYDGPGGWQPIKHFHDLDAAKLHAFEYKRDVDMYGGKGIGVRVAHVQTVWQAAL